MANGMQRTQYAEYASDGCNHLTKAMKMVNIPWERRRVCVCVCMCHWLAALIRLIVINFVEKQECHGRNRCGPLIVATKLDESSAQIFILLYTIFPF